MIDIARDPRWGRIVEGAGEGPYLGAAVAAAQVRGFQGDHLGAPERVIAGPKHFAGYGAAVGGRDYDEVNLPDAELWNVYFPPFQAALAAGAGNVMTAYMDLNGIPESGNRWLFTEVLRGQWGFDAFVVSDANAVRSLVTHGFAADLPDAAARGVNVGVDLEMAITEPAYSHLPEAVERGDSASTRWMPAFAACWRPSCGSACSRIRTSTWTGPDPSWPIPRTARWPESRQSARLCCCATTATCCRWTRRACPR
jgi:beta-glucosidase